MIETLSGRGPRDRRAVERLLSGHARVHEFDAPDLDAVFGPVPWVRGLARYLVPRSGIASPDTWNVSVRVFFSALLSAATVIASAAALQLLIWFVAVLLARHLGFIWGLVGVAGWLLTIASANSGAFFRENASRGPRDRTTLAGQNQWHSWWLLLLAVGFGTAVTVVESLSAAVSAACAMAFAALLPALISLLPVRRSRLVAARTAAWIGMTALIAAVGQVLYRLGEGRGTRDLDLGMLLLPPILLTASTAIVSLATTLVGRDGALVAFDAVLRWHAAALGRSVALWIVPLGSLLLAQQVRATVSTLLLLGLGGLGIAALFALMAWSELVGRWLDRMIAALALGALAIAVLTLSTATILRLFPMSSSVYHWVPPLAAVGILAVCAAIRVDGLGMSRFYQQRLTQAFLGASNAVRWPEPESGIDRDDDIRLTELRGTAPQPIFCAALNLTKGARIGAHERRAASFTMSTDESGYELPRMWRRDAPTRHYVATGDLSVGEAMAISGAAVSPNMGYHSSPELTALLSMFNIRLGRWFRNPGRKRMFGNGGAEEMLRYAPRMTGLRLVRELTGQVDELSGSVFVSDGGHFENLGIYELVRRKCRTIVCIDASADERPVDLMRAIALARSDFGCEISVRRGEGVYSGRIVYDDDSEGTLIVLKPCRSAGWPLELLESSPSGFPNTPTTKQQFSEHEFECYRILGQVMVHEAEQALRECLPKGARTARAS